MFQHKFIKISGKIEFLQFMISNGKTLESYFKKIKSDKKLNGMTFVKEIIYN
jgi:hypothetical protein